MISTIHFATGKWLGSKYGDRIAGGQLLGQKNTAMGIWMANTYLNPLASVFLAFYSIWQNLFNSWQLWHQDREKLTKLPPTVQNNTLNNKHLKKTSNNSTLFIG